MKGQIHATSTHGTMKTLENITEPPNLIAARPSGPDPMAQLLRLLSALPCERFPAFHCTAQGNYMLLITRVRVRLSPWESQKHT